MFVLFALVIFSPFYHIIAAEDTYHDAVYFASKFCSSCQKLEDEGVIDQLIQEGYDIETIYLEDDSAYTKLLYDYQYTYDVDFFGTSLTPVIFAGDRYFVGYEDIKNAVDQGTIQQIMNEQSMLEIESAPDADFSLITFVLLGFVDGVNPCAIAMLLLFISMLSFSDQSKTLLKISFIFISAIYISYFLFGTLLYQTLSSLSGIAPILEIVPWVIVSISIIVVILNLYDFIVTTLKKYDKVKNQLPSKIQKFNRRLMETFTKKLEEGSLMIYVIAFFIGVVISFTEFLCTGQAYFTAILHLIHFSSHVGRGLLLLAIYNLIFVLPLIVIALVAVKTKSVIRVSSFMRKNLHWIKLFNVIVFLAIIIYYVIFVL
jgi:cytochrome c biogenesis protein CcdA/glutaredoxin